MLLFSTQKTTETLKKEVLMLEMSIVEKKKQLEKLVHEMKEVNLQSLTVTTEDHHLFYDGKLEQLLLIISISHANNNNF